MHAVAFREAVRNEPKKKPPEDGAGGDADEGGDSGEKHGFDQERSENRDCIGSQDRADGELAGARGGARQKESGDVGRGYQQDQGDNRKEHIERLAQRAGGKLRERGSVEEPSRARSIGILPFPQHLLMHFLSEAGVELGERDAGSQPQICIVVFVESFPRSKGLRE